MLFRSAVFDQANLGRDFPLDMDLIERIEFMPGPGGAVYGQNAMLAVVNVVTRRGADISGLEATGALQTPQRLSEGRLSWGVETPGGLDAVVSVSGLRARGEDRSVNFGLGTSGRAAGLDGERDGELLFRLRTGRWASVFSIGNRRKDDPLGTYLSDPLTPGQYQIGRAHV